jgi:hypothetical protein
MNNNVRNARSSEFTQQANIEQQKNREEYAQSLAQGHRVPLSNAASLHAMTSGEPSMTQHILLEQQNKKRLLIARQEQDSMSGPDQHELGHFRRAVSFLGARPGLSPNPADTEGRTPKLGHQGLPGSPLLASGMQQQRGSSAPNKSLPDPSLSPFSKSRSHSLVAVRVRVTSPSSYLGANFHTQQPTPQEEAMHSAQMNGQRRDVPPKPGMLQQLVQDEIALQQKEAMRKAKQVVQDRVLAHPAPARGQKYDNSRGPSIQELLEQNHAPPRQVQMEAEAQKRRDIEAKRRQAEAHGSLQQFLQEAEYQQMQGIAMKKATMHIEQQGIPQGQNPTIYQQHLERRYFSQMQQAQQEQAGQQPGQQPQNFIATSPQDSQSSISNQQSAGLSNMSVQQLRQQYQQRKAQLLQTFGQNVPQQHVQKMHQLELLIKKREQQAGQQPGQQPQNITATLPQGSQRGTSNQQDADFVNMTPNQMSETAPKKKGTKSKKVHFHSPPSPLQH